MTNKKLLAGAALTGLLFSASFAQAKDTKKAKKEVKETTVKCSGVNACKGKGACGTATHSCAGQNACKGKGWIKISSKACEKKGGKVL